MKPFVVGIISVAIIAGLVAGGIVLMRRDGDTPAADTSGGPSSIEIKDSETEKTMPFIPEGDVTTLTITDLTVGTGEEAVDGKKITVHYRGTLAVGDKEFDSSYNRGKPFTFTLGAGEVITGWDLGFTGMRVGGKRRLVIPSDMAYGPSGAGGVIGPNADLVFEVELVAVN